MSEDHKMLEELRRHYRATARRARHRTGGALTHPEARRGPDRILRRATKSPPGRNPPTLPRLQALQKHCCPLRKTRKQPARKKSRRQRNRKTRRRARPYAKRLESLGFRSWPDPRGSEQDRTRRDRRDPRRRVQGLQCASRVTEPRCVKHHRRSARGSPLETGVSVAGRLHKRKQPSKKKI